MDENTGAFALCIAPLLRGATVTTVPVESTWVTAKNSPSIWRNPGTPLGGLTALGAAGAAVVVGATVVVVGPAVVVVGPPVVVGAGVVVGGGATEIVNCVAVALRLENRTPTGPRTAVPTACAAGDPPRVTVRLVPVASTPFTVIVSVSINRLAGAPQGSAAFSVIFVSDDWTAFARDDVFAADATREPGGRLLRFCVRVAFSLTLTF